MKETRIAVVMNGGISLAVWMGGVTHELNRMRLARTGVEPEDEGERRVHRAWLAILEDEKVDVQVVVDTIAGTSAGGLNGTLLATAISRGSDLDSLREIWLDRASLEGGKLLREDHVGARTLLDGDYFADEINEALATISKSDLPSGPYEPQEVVLLVTATSIGANLASMRLEGDRRDSYRDSRRVFRFQRRLKHDGIEIANDFRVPRPVRRDGTPAGPLARAARASASFPVAFAPIMEDGDLQEMRAPGSPPVGRYPLMDGGVLDNAPFGPIIEALQRRPVDKPFERILLYVVPSARSREIATLGDDELPDVSKVVRALASTVREPDQRLDVETLGAAFEQMSYQGTTTHAVLADILMGTDEAPKRLATAASTLFPTYRIGRAEAFYRWLQGLGEPLDLVRPRPADVDPDRISVVPVKRDEASDDPVTPGDPWQWGSSTAERALRWLGRAMVEIAVDDRHARGDPELLEQAFATLGKAQRRVSEVGAAVEGQVEPRVRGIREFASRLREFETVVREQPDVNAIGEAVDDAAGATAAWLASMQHPTETDSIVSTLLEIEVVSSVFAWGGDDGDAPLFTYLQVSPAAPSLVEVAPLGLQPDSHGYEDQLQQWAAKKLYGERWGHFGAFATLAGRKHDWLWGRLDAASTLTRMLGPDVKTALVDDLVDAILTAEGTGRKAVAEDAQAVRTLDAQGLYRLMLEEDGGEDKRELLLKTVPEVLGEAKDLPLDLSGVTRTLAGFVEFASDYVETRNASKKWLADLFRRAWR